MPRINKKKIKKKARRLSKRDYSKKIYLSGDKLLKMEKPVFMETSCSLLGPPLKTATLNLLIISLIITYSSTNGLWLTEQTLCACSVNYPGASSSIPRFSCDVPKVKLSALCNSFSCI